MNRNIFFFILLLLVSFATNFVFGQEYKGATVLSTGINVPFGQTDIGETHKYGFSISLSHYRTVMDYIALGGEFYYGFSLVDRSGMFHHYRISPSVGEYLTINGGGASIISINPVLILILNPRSRIKFSLLGGMGYYALRLNGGGIGVPEFRFGNIVRFTGKFGHGIGINYGMMAGFPFSKNKDIIISVRQHNFVFTGGTGQFITTLVGLGFLF